MTSLPPPEPFPRSLQRMRDRASIAGTIGLVICLALMFVDRTRDAMYPAYLVGFVFWFGIAMGGASLTMLHHLTGGSWGLLVRRPLEAAALVTLPLALIFVPLLFNLEVLYPWARAADPYHELIEKKVAYLNPGFFRLRIVGYFVVWCAIALLLNRLSRAEDQSQRGAASVWLKRISAPGLGLVFLTASFAAIDWTMSLEPEWFSSIYPAMLITGWGLATWASMILVVGALRRTQPMQTVATPGRFQDLGSFTLAFVMLWAYTSFMQYLIIWSGNLVEEIPWYLRRSRGGWQLFVGALVLFHFFTPFFLLLSRGVKRRAPKLMALACWILLMHFVDCVWLVLPARIRDPLSPAIGVDWIGVGLALFATASIGGICIACFLFFLQRSALVPLKHPALDDLGHAEEEDAEENESTAPPATSGVS